jgi:hypothetical protein
LTLLVRAKSGVRGVKSLLNVNSKKAAFNILKGDRNTYVEWSTAQDVKNRSDRFFKQGKPFAEPLGAGTLHLERMKKIRNRIAHRSPHADKKFKELMRELFGSYKPETPGGFLLSTPPANFGLISGTANKATVIETYAEILKTLAYQIAG